MTVVEFLDTRTVFSMCTEAPESTHCCGGLDMFVPNTICGFRAHLGRHIGGGRDGSLGEHVVFMKTVF